MSTITVGSIEIGPGRPLVLISGPCVIEDAETMRRAAAELGEMCGVLGLPLVFKSSYLKDNRTDGDAHRGPGLERGLQLLQRLKQEHDVVVTTDVHRPEDVEPVAHVVDLVQIPAFLCRQTSLLQAAGRAGQAVNIKKGQFMSPAAMAGSVGKVRAAGRAAVMLTERGSCFGQDRLVCDLTAVPLLQQLGCPVAVDVGHAAAAPDEIPILARAAVAAGADALFLESHPDPRRALCDGGRMLSLHQLRQLLPLLIELSGIVRASGGGTGGQGPAEA